MLIEAINGGKPWTSRREFAHYIVTSQCPEPKAGTQHLFGGLSVVPETLLKQSFRSIISTTSLQEHWVDCWLNYSLLVKVVELTTWHKQVETVEAAMQLNSETYHKHKAWTRTGPKPKDEQPE